MKILITESELNRFIVNYMNYMYNPDDLDITSYKTFPKFRIYRKNGERVMVMDIVNNYFLFDYDIIWSYFENDLGFSNEQIIEGLTIWLDETMGVRGLDVVY